MQHVADYLNLTTYCSATLVLLVALWCGIAQELGKKGKSGVLKSVVSRKKFLTDPSHRPPHWFRVGAEARVVVESCGYLVQRFGTARDPARELYLKGRSAGQDDDTGFARLRRHLPIQSARR